MEQGHIGFTLAHEQFAVPELVKQGVAAEKAGFEYVSTSDHLQPWQANEGHSGLAWVTLAALGQQTHDLMMGTGVTCPTMRYTPAVVAEAWSSLSLLYPGRVFLGIGSGEALNEEAGVGMWPKWPERSERLVEASQIIRELWKGGEVRHEGKYYKVSARLYDPPATPITLFMAGNGPKAMRRCGQYGDGLITDPKTWKQYKSEFEAGARAAGKDPKGMPVMTELFMVVGNQKQAEQSAERWRFLPKAWNPYWNIPDPREIQKRADGEIPMKELLADWVVSTNPKEHINKLNELFASGVTHVHIHSAQDDQMQVIDFYGNQVLPKIQRQKRAA